MIGRATVKQVRKASSVCPETAVESTTEPMSQSKLQHGFSELHRHAVYDAGSRARKAQKAAAVLRDCVASPGRLAVLEIGCAAGYGTAVYAETFGSVAAIDIDLPALAHAQMRNRRNNVRYLAMDSQQLAFASGTFDVVVCTHVYEHVPDAERLLGEIHRVLRPGGVCFFSAGNRIALMEPHYRLPLLSVVPKSLAHWYLRALGRGRFYYETHLTYWGLRRLVSRFELRDYTLAVIDDPERFAATDIVRPGSLRQRMARWLLTFAYWVCPTYLWVLRKPPVCPVHELSPP